MSNAVRKAEVEYWDDPARERHMQHEHAPAWLAMIARMEERDLRGKEVLDFGCSQGGFLRLLYDLKPFRGGLGVDIARKSVEEAAKLNGARPCEYETIDALRSKGDAFDLAFSHEVVYLLPDLAAHAKEIHRLLKPAGVYYLAIGCHTDNPLWPRWKNTVAEFSPVPPQDYSLRDIASAFQKNGFAVGVQRLACQGFFSYDALDDRYLKSPAELADFMTRDMMYFRLARQG
jgi:SAM-dependent methyltransferase